MVYKAVTTHKTLCVYTCCGVNPGDAAFSTNNIKMENAERPLPPELTKYPAL